MNASSTRYRRKGAVVVEDRLEDLVDCGFWILAAGLKCLGHLVKQQTTAGSLSRYREDSAVADERPQHLWRVGRGDRQRFDILPRLRAGDSSYYADWSSS